MFELTGAQTLIALVVGYVAVVALVRLMNQRRKQVLEKLQADVQRERARKKREAQREKKRAQNKPAA